MSKRRILYILALFVGIMFLALALAVGSATSVLASRSSAAPEHPRILYLAPQGSVRGLVNDQVMQARGATPVRNWTSAQSYALVNRLDALIMDTALLDTMNPWDEVWLRTQFHDGVVLVGLGVDDDSFAHRLGLDTFRVPAEANVPLGPTGYRLTDSLALGTPEDLKLLELSDWINRAARGDLDSPSLPLIEHPARRSFGDARGTVASANDLDGLFIRLRLSIDGIYKTRAEYAEQLKNWNRNSP